MTGGWSTASSLEGFLLFLAAASTFVAERVRLLFALGELSSRGRFVATFVFGSSSFISSLGFGGLFGLPPNHIGCILILNTSRLTTLGWFLILL